MDNDDDDVPLLDNELNVDERSLLLQQRGVQRGKALYKIKTNYEALDYEIVQNDVRMVEQRKIFSKSNRYCLYNSFARDFNCAYSGWWKWSDGCAVLLLGY